MKNQISNNKIRQVVLLGLILSFLYMMGINLREFLPALLGAITLYVIFRHYYFRLTEVKKWKAWMAASFLIVLSALVVIIPVYYLVNELILRLLGSREYVESMVVYAEKIHQYIIQQTGYDIVKSIDVKKIGTWVTESSSSLLTTTIDMLTTVVTVYFILYFMLINARRMERGISIIIPLKKSNINKLGDKFRKLIIANAVGIPVVALGQGLMVLIGYLIFGVSSPFFLFILTSIASVIPIVGSAVVYIPVALMLWVEQNTVGAVGVLTFGFLSAGVDNILRFTFLKKIENIHPLNSVFGLILGLKLFGFIGLIFGPILISITILLIQVYHDEFSEEQESNEAEESFCI